MVGGIVTCGDNNDENMTSFNVGKGLGISETVVILLVHTNLALRVASGADRCFSSPALPVRSVLVFPRKNVTHVQV